jgi:pimeloyl-ACP methyl ester carboxylesterase
MVVNTRLISPMVAPVILAHLARPGVRNYLCRIAVHLAEVERSLQPSINAVVNSDIQRQVIWGYADTINPPDADRLAAFGGDMHWLENCGHLPHMEKRSEVNRLLSCLVDGFSITNEI